MRVGIPTEIKNNEFRVAITPAGVAELVVAATRCSIQAGAGDGSAITDDDFKRAGAQIIPTADEVWAEADLLLKVKEPIEPEYRRLREDQILFTYLHLAAVRAVHRRAAGVRHHGDRLRDRADRRRRAAAARPDERGRGPARPAGRRVPPDAPHGGRGVLLGGVPGVRAGQGRRHRRRRRRRQRRRRSPSAWAPTSPCST